MKLTLNNMRLLKSRSERKLEKRVCAYVIGHWQDYTDKTYLFRDVLEHGCQSGIVPELIYYGDTVAFYKLYREDIQEILLEIMDETGLYDPAALFGDKWEKEDPFACDVNNRNLLAWFGFEETLRQIAYHFEALENYV